MAAERDKLSWEETDKLLRPLTLHAASVVLFDNDTRFIYYAFFDTPLDKYLDDAATIFGQSRAPGFFVHLEGFPDDQAAYGNPETFRKFLRDNRGRRASTNSRVILVLRLKRLRRRSRFAMRSAICSTKCNKCNKGSDNALYGHHPTELHTSDVDSKRHILYLHFWR